MLSVRLNKEIEKKIEEYCDLNKISKTDLVKEALTEFLSTRISETSPFDSGRDLFGVDMDAPSDLSTSYKKRLKNHFNDKNTH